MAQTLQLGPLIFPWATLVPLLAIGVGFFAGWRRGKRAGIDASPALYRVILVGVVSARFAFVWQQRAVYLLHPLDILDLRDGGWIPEVGLAAAAFYALYLIRRQVNLRKPLVAAALVAGAVAVAGNAALLAAPGQKVLLPTVALASLDGRGAALSGFAGRPTVVNLWATWCPPCRREMPMLQQAQATHPDVNFVFVNQGEDAAAVNAYFTAQHLAPRNVLLDERMQTGAALGSRGLPTTLFFDANGELAATRIGELSAATLAQRIDALRASSPPLSRTVKD